MAAGSTQQFVFEANVVERTMHTVAVQLTNGAASGTATQSLNNFILFVNNTLVSLNAGFTGPHVGAMAFDTSEMFTQLISPTITT